jgi:hypothetical protein
MMSRGESVAQGFWIFIVFSKIRRVVYACADDDIRCSAFCGLDVAIHWHE